MSQPVIHRRGLLAVLGLSVASGCSALPGDLFNEGSSQLDGDTLRALTTPPAPSVPERVPVPIDARYLEARQTRIQELLDSVPTPLGPNDVPNGAVREELTVAHGRAQSSLYDADQAGTPYETMTALRSARTYAREVAAGWRNIDGDLTRETLLAEAQSTREATEEFRGEWDYLGADTVRAVLLYARIEQGVESAMTAATVDTDRVRAEPENPVTVGDLARDVERARTSLEDARYLYEQYVGTLDREESQEAVLRSAAETLTSDLEARQADLPAFDPDEPGAAVDHEIADTPAEWVLRELHTRLISPREFEGDHVETHPAQSVLIALKALARVQALSEIYASVDNGETYTVDSAAAVAVHRRDAIDAIETALDHTHHPRLTYSVAVDLAEQIQVFDRRLGRVRSDEAASRIAREIAGYVRIAETARALPEAAADATVALSTSK